METANYFLDFYGTCTLGLKCLELKPGVEWLGRFCPQWRPLGVRSHEELKARFIASASPSSTQGDE